MKLPTKLILSTCSLFSLAASVFALPAFADSVPVVNGTFDVINNPNPANSGPPTLTDTAAGYAYTTSFGTGVGFEYGSATGPSSGDLPGWVLTDNGPNSANGENNYGGVELLGSDYVNQGTSSGLAGYLWDNSDSGGTVPATLSQTLNSDLAANSTYTLSLSLADRIDQGDPGSAFTLQLYAGTTQLFSVSPTLTSTFTNYSFEYTSPSSSAAVGQPLEIVFGSTSATSQALIDNVSLDVVSAPEPSSFTFILIGCSLMALTTGFRIRHRWA